MHVMSIMAYKKSGSLDRRNLIVVYVLKARYYSPFIAATPGRTFPSIASSIAPPPVET